jgi:hypothetical protein
VSLFATRVEKWRVGVWAGFADLDRSTRGCAASLTMTICGAAIVTPRCFKDRVIR